MGKPSLILIGAGGHAISCIDVIEQQAQFQIAGLVGQLGEQQSDRLGYPVFAGDDDLPRLAAKYTHALIAIGQIASPAQRMQIYYQLIKLGFKLPTVIAPTAIVSKHAVVEAGSIIMHGAIVNAGARIGRNCIINTRALIEHGVVVNDHCHIATGATLNGNVVVGEGTFVGSGSIVKEGILIGQSCIVGMGLTIRHNVISGTRFTGERVSE
jgi:sugar O-acyltransferase (sialic acid O-acetyltransferase NeuD family)